MSTSLLYHGFGVRGYKYVKTHYEGGSVIFTIDQSRFELECSSCGSREVIRRGKVDRRFRSLPIGRKPVWIMMGIQRVLCLSCGLVRQVKVRFAEPRRSYTKAFERYALDLSRHMTILDVARHLDVSWDVVKEIQKRYLKRHYLRPKLKALKQIAIDEITIGRGHQYLTIVLDLKSGAVVFVGEGKGSEALLPFWRRLKCSRAKIEAIAMDMSPAYISAAKENLPEASIVFDHFHVVKMFNDKLDELRRKLYRDADTALQKRVLKGTRWLLLKSPTKLDESRDEQQRLKEALELNHPLAIAYYLKEDLRQLWLQDNKTEAETFLDDWISQAESSDVPILTKFATTLSDHRKGLLAYYDFPISNGPLEGTNNKIKTMKRQAYGFRDRDFFKLKIMAIHETKYALVG
jgi:transposase